MKTYLIFKNLSGGFRICDGSWRTETEKFTLEQINQDILIRKMKEQHKLLHPVTKKYGEVSDIAFSEVDKARDFVYFADDYYLYGFYTIKTNKLLSVLDAIVERYNFMKRWGVKPSQINYLIKDIIKVLRTDFEELERKSLLQTEEESK